jgi:hypothetical protein
MLEPIFINENVGFTMGFHLYAQALSRFPGFIFAASAALP